MPMKRTLCAASAVCLCLVMCAQTASAAPEKKGREYYEPRGEIVWEVPTTDKVVALTFDDGPDPVYTPKILELLEKYHAKASFFVVGERAERFPQLIVEEFRHGHDIGNHTYGHTYFNLRKNGQEKIFEQEIRRTEETVFALTGRLTPLFRPPGGFYNSRLIDYTKSHGYLPILWSWHQDTRDWARPGTGRITSKVLHNLRSGDIILMHDHVEGRSQTVDALKIILPEIEKRGYRCVTVTELLKHQKNSEPVKNSEKSKKAGP